MHRPLVPVVVAALAAALVAFAPSFPQAAPPAAPASAPKGAPAAAPGHAWLVTLELAKWDASKTPFEQPGFSDHMAHVQQLAAEGTLLVGGPLLESFESLKLTGSMMIVKAADAEAAKKIVGDDALVKNELMKIGSVRAFMPGAGAWLTPAANAPAGGKR